MGTWFWCGKGGGEERSLYLTNDGSRYLHTEKLSTRNACLALDYTIRPPRSSCTETLEPTSCRLASTSVAPAAGHCCHARRNRADTERWGSRRDRRRTSAERLNRSPGRRGTSTDFDLFKVCTNSKSEETSSSKWFDEEAQLGTIFLL